MLPSNVDYILGAPEDHDLDYYLGRLEDPWTCEGKESPLSNVLFNIKNVGSGLFLLTDWLTQKKQTGSADQSNSPEYMQWTFWNNCDGTFGLMNMGTIETYGPLMYDPETKTLKAEVANDPAYAKVLAGDLVWSTSDPTYPTPDPSLQWDILKVEV